MDGENHGKNPIKMDDLGGFPMIFGLTPNPYNNNLKENAVAPSSSSFVQGQSLVWVFAGGFLCLLCQRMVQFNLHNLRHSLAFHGADAGISRNQAAPFFQVIW